jgi:2-keto-3-deoxy-L-rhamnonate aldolase RhmA
MNLIIKLLAPTPLLGTLVSTRAPEAAEALALAGYDLLFLDLEHSTIDIAAAQTILQAVGSKAFCVLRLGSHNPEHITKALDTGCDGIVIPFINTAGEARAAVAAARYPPLGARSIGIGRAHAYGLNFAAYIESANATVALILQIEHKDAVANIHDILAVPGFDAIFVGPYDLSGSMGLLGQLDHPEVIAAIERVRNACAASDKPFGIFCGSLDRAKAEAARNTNLIVCATDLMLMTSTATKHLTGLRNNP